MLAEAKVTVAQGATVEVDLRNIGPVAGRIIWAGEGKFGIAFDRAIDPQAVRRQVVSQSDLPPHLRRTGLEKGPLYRRPCSLPDRGGIRRVEGRVEGKGGVRLGDAA